jgi:leucine dehydrogenase
LVLECREIPVEGYEKVIEAIDKASGLHSFIAVHSTRMGPSLGGTRIYPYSSAEEAFTDVLRLSKGMTYKSAMAEIGLGGGKSVIIADPLTQKSDALLRAFGKAVDSLGGSYICAEDMGTSVDDMATIKSVTPFVVALAETESSGDPSRFTAYGVLRGIQATARHIWGSDSLQGKVVAVQGLGSVGAKLARFLFWEGAQLIVTDVDFARTADIAGRYGARVVGIDEILSVPCDILAPCALGGVLNDQTIPQLKCRAVAGAANNQLLEPKHGEDLVKRGILYAPDLVINGGGIINVSVELEAGGYDPVEARRRVDAIYQVLLSVYNIAEKRKISSSRAADDLAEHKLRYGIGRRRTSEPLFRS